MLFCVERCYKNLVFLISFYFDQQIIFYDKNIIFLKPRLRKTKRAFVKAKRTLVFLCLLSIILLKDFLNILSKLL